MSLTTNLTIPTSDALKEEILQVFAEVTRYPSEILDPEASLEEDLGIDSVKLGEIFSVLREKYNLPDPETLSMPRDALRTINGIHEALYLFLTTGKIPQGEASDIPVMQEMPVAISQPIQQEEPSNGSHDSTDLSALEAELSALALNSEIKAAPVTQQTEMPNVAAPPSRPADSAPSLAELKEEIMTIFADVTRYPKEILDPDANLEEDLGIDSVKLGEIFSVLRERYVLPDPEILNLPREYLKTINGISQALHDFLSGNARWEVLNNKTEHSDFTAPQEKTAIPHEIAQNSREEVHLPDDPPLSVDLQHDAAVYKDLQIDELKEEILTVFAEVTRYPKEILDPDSSLEEDLGIDSVKLGEIFSVLREKYKLPDPETLDMPREALKSINGITNALHNFLVNGAIPGRGEKDDNEVQKDTLGIIPNQNGNGKSNGITDLKKDNGQEVSVGLPTMPSQNGSSNGNGRSEVQNDVITESFARLTKEKKPFEGKIGFISGSGRGLGKEIAVYLAELGATVIINSFHSRDKGIETEREIKDKGGKAYHIWGSMANPTQLHAMFDEIESKFGYLDFFISNASNGMLAPIEHLQVEHWQKAFMTNVVGLQQGAVRAVKMMKKRGKGKIITLSSPAAHGYVEYFGAMGAVKAAVESFTKAMAIEFAPHNIQVNCVSPGPLKGDLITKWPESKRLVDEWEKATPYERLCNGDDVAHFIAYLLSDPVKLFTGSILVQDGGISSKGW